MSAINEANLPGVGKKFWLEASDGGRISIIAYNSGEYEIYLTPRGEEFPTSAVRLTPKEAEMLGSAFPSGMHMQEDVQAPQTTCVVVPADSPALGSDAASLKEGAAFVVAVTTVSEDHVTSPVGHVLQTADILYLMGPDKDRKALAQTIQSHG
ncbi:MAG: hypothetical protein Q9M27_03440 [Mariprofundaceae bacterium]|nr:hypothetical protein [Mariprofundaceae bacterium]